MVLEGGSNPNARDEWVGTICALNLTSILIQCYEDDESGGTHRNKTAEYMRSRSLTHAVIPADLDTPKD